MRQVSLYSKIFLWFILALVLIGGVGILLTIIMTQQGIILSGNRDILREAVALHGQQGLALLESKGQGALLQEIRQVRERSHLFLFFMNPDGTLIAPEEVPDAIRRKAFQHGEGFFRMGEFALSVQKIISPSGKKYLVVGSVHDRPLLPRLPSDWKVFLIRFVGFLLASAGVCYLLARHIADPIVRLNRVTMALASGNLAIRVEEELCKRHDEIGQLSRDFNLMALRIQELIRGQERLLRDISHELRSPLARLGVAIELARKKSQMEDDEIWERMEHELGQIDDMITQLLTLSRMEAGQEMASLVPLDLSKLVQEVAKDADFEAQDRGCSVQAILPESLIIEGNPKLLRRAIENVVRNAIRHTAKGSTVKLFLETSKDRLLLHVQDAGPGVPEEELEKIFEPFYRLDEARNREGGGVGLGLSIAKRAIAVHRGSIKAFNRDEGGLEVVITLPLKPNDGGEPEQN